MRHTGTIPRGPVELDDLAGLFDVGPPVVTVCLATPAAVEGASRRDQLRWSDVRRDLRSEGAPEAALDGIDALIPDAHQAGEGLAVVAGASGVVWAEHSPVPPRRDVARCDTLPSLGTMIAWRQQQPTYLLVLVDHRGADVFSSGWRVRDQHREVEGTYRYPMEKNAPGGWSQRRYQQHAVENWARNAGQVADEVARLADRTNPEVVLVGGDPRALELLLSALPERVRVRTETVGGTRAADGGEDRTAWGVSRIVETVSARETVAVLEEFHEQLGRRDRAVEGVEAVLRAFRQGQVAVLLLHDDPDDTRRACFTPQGNLVASDPAELAGAGGSVVDGRLADVALRAAAMTGAGVRLVPRAGGPLEGIGALLRWGA